MPQPINDKYSVSKEGIVYKLWKYQGQKVIEPILRDGVPKVSIHRKYESVAELVLKYWGNREVDQDEQVVHKDGDIFNCSLDNLEVIPKPEVGDSCTIDGVEAKMITPIHAVTVKGEVYSYRSGGYLGTYTNRRGYRVVNLQREKQHLVHRLVAEAFIPNPENKNTVDHINENKLDNRVENLRWATRSENTGYYNEIKQTREYKLIQEKLDKATEQTKESKRKIKELTRLNKELVKERERIERRTKKLEEHLEMLQTLVSYKDQNDAMNRSIGKGLKGFTGIPKALKINGTKYSSIYEAAKYIVSTETAKGYPKRIDTVRKELRRFVNGERPSWTMYGNYKVEAP